MARAQPLTQRVEGERHGEHERAGEPRRAREIGAGQERVCRRDGERVGGGDDAGQGRVDHRATDDHRRVEQPVAHRGVSDGERIDEDERRAELRIDGAPVELTQGREGEREVAAQAEPDAHQQHRRLLIDQR